MTSVGTDRINSNRLSGRSAARPARLLWEQEVLGSNPSAPTLFYIYIIYSKNLQRYYVGSTEAVEKRLQEHNAGKSRSTRAGAPWELIYTESFSTRSEAMLHE